jgi:hypothetical protein
MHRARSSLSKNRQSVLTDPRKQNCQRDKASLKRDNAPNSDGVTARSKKRAAPGRFLFLSRILRVRTARIRLIFHSGFFVES